jgi:hypothetical protein
LAKKKAKKDNEIEKLDDEIIETEEIEPEKEDEDYKDFLKNFHTDEEEEHEETEMWEDEAEWKDE